LHVNAVGITSLLIVALGSVACRRPQSSAGHVTDARADAGAVARPTPRLPPLHAESWRIALAVPNFEPAVVAVPLGARSARPIIIALHGYADRADWQCGTWTGITGAHPFILCPQGRKLPGSGDVPRYTYDGASQTEQELRAALKALKARFGEHVAAGPVIIAGYSLGATRAARIALQEPGYFSRLVLVEGAAGQWSAGDAAIFAKGGGQKLMIVCAQSACANAGKRAVLFTQRARSEAELVFPGQFGHLFDGRVAGAIKARLPWLVQGDERWTQKREQRP
jgi:pimeloyl-ACP methyl ester carboxylesterase